MHRIVRQGRYLVAALAAFLTGTAAAAASDGIMPASQQNALVHKYCAVCHTDAAKNGGLSLEHFDVRTAPPSLIAMLLSKLTGGVALKTVRRASSNPDAAAVVNNKMRSGAMGAAGIPVPDQATMDGLIQAFAEESVGVGATEWNVERPGTTDGAVTLTASSLRELPRAGKENEAEVYRLIAACSPVTREGYMQLTWSPVPQSGSLTASVDGGAGSLYQVKGSEKMGNGSGLELHGLASVMLAETKPGAARTGIPFPAQSLTIRDLFPGETVEFSFSGLPEKARQQLQTCFP